jgi:hypothetical protein
MTRMLIMSKYALIILHWPYYCTTLHLVGLFI